MDLRAFESAPRDWQRMPLSEACDRITSGGTPSRGVPEYFIDGSVPWVKTRELLDRVIHDTEEHITEQALAGSAAKLLPAETILMAMYASPTVGRLGLLGREMACNQACCALIPAKDRIDARFLFYQLLFARDELQSLASGSAQQNLSARTIARLRLPFPPIEEQRAIASVLGALDDKIELNRRMNETLEALARAIFTSWFVDFDPVRTKAERRQPVGMDAETATLFPDSFTDSPLGPLPSGWRVSTLGSVVAFSRSSVDPGDWPHEVFDHYSIPAFDDGARPSHELGSSIRSAKFAVPRGAVLLSKLNPRIPRIWLTRPDSDRRAIASTEFLVSTPRTGMNTAWMYCFYATRSFLERMRGLATGTSGSHQRVKQEAVLATRIVVPPRALVDRFGRIVEPMLARLQQAGAESEKLAEARDALLPELVSGRVRIRLAEAISN